MIMVLKNFHDSDFSLLSFAFVVVAQVLFVSSFLKVHTVVPFFLMINEVNSLFV